MITLYLCAGVLYCLVGFVVDRESIANDFKTGEYNVRRFAVDTGINILFWPIGLYMALTGK